MRKELSGGACGKSKQSQFALTKTKLRVKILFYPICIRLGAEYYQL